MKSKGDVGVQREQFGIEIDAEQFRLVGTVNNGMRIYGSVSAHLGLYSMELTAYQILVKMVEYGVMLRRLVFVKRRRYGMDGRVFLHRFHVRMERYGIWECMHVFVQRELTQTGINVMRFRDAEMGKFIIL